MNVLLIEDDPRLQAATTRTLKHLYPDDCTITTVGAVREALLILDEAIKLHGACYFELILSDYNLLGVEKGDAILNWLKQHSPLDADNFIFFTSDEEARQHGARLVLKPASRDELRAAIATTLLGRP